MKYKLSFARTEFEGFAKFEGVGNIMNTLNKHDSCLTKQLYKLTNTVVSDSLPGENPCSVRVNIVRILRSVLYCTKYINFSKVP